MSLLNNEFRLFDLSSATRVSFIKNGHSSQKDWLGEGRAGRGGGTMGRNVKKCAHERKY